MIGVVLLRIASTQNYCQYVTQSGRTLDFGPVRDFGTVNGADDKGNVIQFNMCTVSTGTDCSMLGFEALATQSGGFGCSILSQWEPVITPPTWSETPNGVQMVIQNGDACPDGTSRGIQVDFECGNSVAPGSFTVTEPLECQYAWTFSTTAACNFIPSPAVNVNDRNFGCGHISCGWMFLIIIPLVGIIVFAVALPLNKFVLQKDKSWIESIPLYVVGPRLIQYVMWAVRFLIFNWPCCPQRYVFKRFNLAKPPGGSDFGSSSSYDDNTATTGSYQDEHL
jgi:hypothetical protein